MDGALSLLLKALEVALKTWDNAQERKYFDRYRQLLKVVQEEESKQIYGTGYALSLRDQAKIDNAYIEIVLLLREFIRNEQKPQ